MKKALLAILIIAAIAAGGLYYFGFFEKHAPKVVSPAIDAIPANAAFIIEWKSFNSFSELQASGNKLLNSLKSSGLMHEEFSNFRYIDSLLRKDTIANDVLVNPVFVSAHLSGVNKFNFLFTTNLPLEVDSSHLEKFFRDRFRDMQLTSRKYEGSAVYELKKSDLPVFSYTIINSVFVGSHSTVLTEEGIRHIRHGKSLRNDVNFSKVMATSKGRESGTLYINYKVLPSFSQLFLTREAQKEFQHTSQFANWTVADIRIKEDAALMSGYVFSNDTNNNYLNIFKNQKAQQIRFNNILPSNVSFCHWAGLSDLKAFFRSYYSWLENGNRFFNVQNRLKAFNDEHKTKFPEDMTAFAGKEFFYFNVPPASSDTLGTGTYFGFETTDAAKAISYFKKIRSSENGDTLSIIKNDVSIFPVHLADLMNFSGLTSVDIECNYAAHIDDYIVMAPTRQDLITLISTTSNGNTLKKSTVYNDMNEYLPGEANVFIFNTPFRSKDLLPRLFKIEDGSTLSDAANFISEQSLFAMQVTSGKDLFFHDIVLKYNPEAAKEQIPVWEAEAEEDLIYVQAVNSKQSEGTFAADIQNKLYYFDEQGTRKFTVQLASPLVSPVTQLAVKSDVPVYLAADAGSLNVFDINGLPHSGFPLKLKADHVAAFDYEGKNDPRILAGTSNGKILCYNSKGETVKNFSVEDLKGRLVAPPQFLRAGSKDYLVFITTDQILITDRKGKTVYNAAAEGLLPETVKPLKKGGNIYLSWLSKDGRIMLISPDRKSQSSVENIRRTSVDHYYEELTGDRKREFLLVDTTGIFMVNDSNEVLRTFDVNGIRKAELVKLRSGPYLAYSTGTENGIIDPKGFPVPGLPVQSNGLSLYQGSTEISYILIRGRKIYKFATPGN